MGYGEPRQWILSLGSYGYDWNVTTKKTTTVSFADAMARAQRSGGDLVASSAPDYNPTFSYDSEGQSHEVWFLDASTFANQLRELDQEGCGGVLVNQLGMEDPGIWPALAQHSSDEATPQLLQQLESIDPKSTIAQIGDGDFLTADLNSRPGSRQLWVDGDYVCETTTVARYPTVVHFDAKPLFGARRSTTAPIRNGPPDSRHSAPVSRHATFHHAQPRKLSSTAHPGTRNRQSTYTHPNCRKLPRKSALELNAAAACQWITAHDDFVSSPLQRDSSRYLCRGRPIALATDFGYVTVGEYRPTGLGPSETDEIVRRIKRPRRPGHPVA
jgi:hypothetical protein